MKYSQQNPETYRPNTFPNHFMEKEFVFLFVFNNSYNCLSQCNFLLFSFLFLLKIQNIEKFMVITPVFIKVHTT